MSDKPFTMKYVLRVTVRHMLKSVDISIGKTFARLPEFIDDEAQSKELFKTLTQLHSLKSKIEEFQSMNNLENKGA